MSNIELLRYTNAAAWEPAAQSAAIEKTLQNLIESQMDSFPCVRFLVPEHATGAKCKGAASVWRRRR